jgi:hypothetical protein
MLLLAAVWLQPNSRAQMSRPVAAGARVAAQQVSVSEQYLLAMANTERVQRGLSPLQWNPALYNAAQKHCQQMAERQSISHQYPGEPELAQRGKQAGAKFNRISENVAEAPTAVRIHDAWMHSEGHRENLLDEQADSVGISVMERNGQLYAVEDFERSVQSLSLDQQAAAVAQLVESAADSQAGSGSSIPLQVQTQTDAARHTCALSTGWAGDRQPWFVMRYTAGELTRLPEALRQKIASGRFTQAAIGACTKSDGEPFSSYNIAVMLFP